MRDRLFLRLFNGSAQKNVSWLRYGAETRGVAIGSDKICHGTLQEAAIEAHGCEVIVLVPASDVLLTRVDVPGRQRQQWKRAVPYALEEQLATEVDSQHFALGDRGEDGNVKVAVVSHELMQQWHDMLSAVGIEPAMMMPDVLMLPWREGTWTVFVDQQMALVRTGEVSGFAVDASNLVAVMVLLIAEQSVSPEAIVLIGSQQASVQQDMVENDCEVPLETLDDQDVIGQMMVGFEHGKVLNLFQGEFSRREQLGKMLRPWRVAAILAGVWLLSAFAMLINDYSSLTKREAALREDIVAVYRQTFPDAKRIVDPLAQMKQGLRDLRGGSGVGDATFLELLAIAGKHIKSSRGVTLERLSYRNNKLELAVSVGSFQLLEQLKQKISKEKGLLVDMGSATSRDNKVAAKITIRWAGK